MRILSLSLCLTLVPLAAATAQARPHVYTHADTLRGSGGPDRAWWDVTFYDLHVRISPSDSTIRGWNAISYRVLKPQTEMQIDLQVPLVADSMIQDGHALSFRRDSNAFFVTLSAAQAAGKIKKITIYYHGKPKIARNPPWDGGLIWGGARGRGEARNGRDSLGNLWAATAVEGLGASAWWPLKDIGSDEPDSQRIAITVPDPMLDVSNGRLRSTTHNPDGTTTFEWFVVSPINNYDVEANAGTYAHFSDTYKGEAGKLTLDFWPLAYHLDTAKVQFQQAKSMLACFEHWFGPYPWYADGYKLIEAPHLGMEHQSGVAYGNGYKNGYSGRDLSGTGTGLTWDFIIVHESAHEWWGNNITMKDHSDMWIHESFANYAENLYVECQQGKAAGAKYVIGTRRMVKNDSPIIPAYGVNAEGSGDMYYKGGNMLHTMRQIVNNDEKWRSVLRGLNKTFWHKTVSTAEFEAEFNRLAGINFDKVFEQYLTTTRIPQFEYKIDKDTLSYHWTNVVPGFDMPVSVTLQDGTYTLLHPTEAWKTVAVKLSSPAAFKIDENYYVMAKPVTQ
ncbi:MAG TPA: M1 family metallopeptidase [Gemmatimonadales bacterium]|nr:M1 family metallopeptidase [Gemmatimonadales bacterium]